MLTCFMKLGPCGQKDNALQAFLVQGSSIILISLALTIIGTTTHFSLLNDCSTQSIKHFEDIFLFH